MKDLAPGWRVRCLTCGLAIDAEQAGIIRLGGRGKSYKLGWCSRCRRVRCFVVERKPPVPKCHKCGYNLRGNVSGRCPECGEPVIYCLHCGEYLRDTTDNRCPECGRELPGKQ
ncbi:MAG: hypothetical protein JSU68_10270 [Phycisphaerales bacterium]|nr:MAG: hypothetical protein JSU68_10270 [Phycisphaerales bacterium]